MKRLIIAAVAATMVFGTAVAGFAAKKPKKPPVDGAAVYKTFCEGCHGAIWSTSIKDPRPGKISKAIKKNDQMKDLKQYQKRDLKAKEMKAIYKAIKNPPAPPDTNDNTIDGAALYYMDCMPCHGSVNNTTVPDRKTLTGEEINTSMQGGSHAGNATSYPVYKANALARAIALTADEANAVADAVRNYGAPNGNIFTSPECSGCHDSDGTPKYPSGPAQ